MMFSANGDSDEAAMWNEDDICTGGTWECRSYIVLSTSINIVTRVASSI